MPLVVLIMFAFFVGFVLGIVVASRSWKPRERGADKVA